MDLRAVEGSLPPDPGGRAQGGSPRLPRSGRYQQRPPGGGRGEPPPGGRHSVGPRCSSPTPGPHSPALGGSGLASRLECCPEGASGGGTQGASPVALFSLEWVLPREADGRKVMRLVALKQRYAPLPSPLGLELVERQGREGWFLRALPPAGGKDPGGQGRGRHPPRPPGGGGRRPPPEGPPLRGHGPGQGQREDRQNRPGEPEGPGEVGGDGPPGAGEPQALSPCRLRVVLCPKGGKCPQERY